MGYSGDPLVLPAQSPSFKGSFTGNPGHNLAMFGCELKWIQHHLTMFQILFFTGWQQHPDVLAEALLLPVRVRQHQLVQAPLVPACVRLFGVKNTHLDARIACSDLPW